MSEEKFDAKKLNIYEKMDGITDEMETVAKNLKVDLTKDKSYKAVSEGDVLRAVKPLEHKYRIYSYPIAREIVESDVIESVSTYKDGGTKEVRQLFLRLKITYRFVDIDTKDYIEMTTYADGVDSGDKAPGKAMTYGDKYALLKAYKVETGDDPDKDGSGELLSKGKKAPDKKVDETPVPPVLATPEQVKQLEEVLTEDEKNMCFSFYHIDSLAGITLANATAMLKKKGV